MGRRGPEPRNPIERMERMSEWEGECLVFKGVTDPKGYGRVSIKNRAYLTHRVAWLYHFGPPPPDKPWVLHRCDNPPCWNPEHLFSGTQQDNTDDMMAKGRHVPKALLTHCQRGHEFTEENTYVKPNGVRNCRTCRKDATDRYRASR